MAAVLDLGLANNPELSGRIVDSSVYYPPLGVTNEHGQWVASVLAATANNRFGISGMAPQSRLFLGDVAQYRLGSPVLDSLGLLQFDILQLEPVFNRALRSGARVLNISMGAKGAPTPAADTVLQQDADLLKFYVESASTSPLLVVSAGNDGPMGRTEWSLFGKLAALLPQQSLIVSAAGTTRGTPWSHATAQGRIDIWAPGEDVAAYGAGGGVIPVSGSSFATPLVAGAAALLFAFDPRLTTSEVRHLLVSTRSTSRGVNGIGLLDAYEALRAAARRPGAPLCGNRIWADATNSVHAQRVAGGSAEMLFNTGTDEFSATYLNLHHGGRRIEAAFDSQLRFSWLNGSWVNLGWQDDSLENYGAAFKSSGAWFLDHDNSIGTFVRGSWQGGQLALQVEVRPFDSTGFASTIQVSGITVPLSSSISTVCAREEVVDSTNAYQCTDSTSFGTVDRIFQWNDALTGVGFTSTNTLHAIDPRGRFVIVPVGVRTSVRTAPSLTWEPCALEPEEFPRVRCRTGGSETTTSRRTFLVRVDLLSATANVVPAPSLVDGSPGDEVYWLSIDDRGEELLLQTSAVTISAGVLSCARSRHLWLRLPSVSSTSATVALEVPIAGNSICVGSLDGGSTTASLRSP